MRVLLVPARHNKQQTCASRSNRSGLPPISSVSEQKPSILVTALNPSIDVEGRVSTVHGEEKNTILSERRWAGGKGVNVARWIRPLGGDPALLLPLRCRIHRA